MLPQHVLGSLGGYFCSGLQPAAA